MFVLSFLLFHEQSPGGTSQFRLGSAEAALKCFRGPQVQRPLAAALSGSAALEYGGGPTAASATFLRHLRRAGRKKDDICWPPEKVFTPNGRRLMTFGDAGRGNKTRGQNARGNYRNKMRENEETEYMGAKGGNNMRDQKTER